MLLLLPTVILFVSESVISVIETVSPVLLVMRQINSMVAEEVSIK